jgi:uncharacterized protein (DUF983 family)
MASSRKAHSDGTATLIFGIIFTVVGAGLLIERLTHIPVWDHVWRLWPVLLIIMGVKVLVDHYSSRPTTPKEP